MTETFSLIDADSRADLLTYLQRAHRVDAEGSARLIGQGDVLAVYTGFLYPAGLLDSAPTVLALRTFRLSDGGGPIDAVVPLTALIGALAGPDGTRNADSASPAPPRVELPRDRARSAWAGVAPPRGGWEPAGDVACDLLREVAKAGIEEVAATVPSGIREQLIHHVRSVVWGRPCPGREDLPAGAAFAGLSLGFLPAGGLATVFRSGAWSRVTTRAGHVLVKDARPTAGPA